MNDDAINIRSIQHYMYCPRRYSLLEVNNDWSENGYVAKADILHEHVHDGSHNYTDSRKTVRSAITVYNDLPEYNLYGVTDCIEFIKAKDGAEICGLEGKYKVCIVEYKPKAPSGKPFNETDAIQVFAQKVCADFVFHCDSEAYLYYIDTRKRVLLPFGTEYSIYDTLLKNLLKKMREVICQNQILPREKGQKCSGCSVADLCFPKDSKYCVKNIIMSQKGNNEYEKAT